MQREIQHFGGRIFWGTICGAALAFWPMAWMGFTVPKLLVLHLGLAVSCLCLYARAGKGRPLALGLVIGYFLLMILYTLFSADPLGSLFGVSESAQGLLTQLVYLTVFLLALQVQDQRGLRRWILATNAVVIFYAFLQFAGWDPLAHIWASENYLGRAFSTLGHPAWLGVWLLLTFPLVRGRFWIFVQALALILTGSKAAVLGLMVLLIGMLMRRRDAWRKALVAAVVLVLVFGAFLLKLYPDRFFLLRSLEARELIWGSSVEMIEDKPLGYGLEMFEYFFPRFRTKEIWNYEAFGATVEHPHNQFLELWISLGPLGVLLFYGLVLVILWPQREKPLAWGVLAALVAQLFGFETVVTSALIWLFLGLLTREKGREFEGKYLLVLFGVLNLLAFGLRIAHVERVEVLAEAAGSLEGGKELVIEGSGEDSEVLLLRAWQAAQNGEEKEARMLYDEAMAMDPAGPRVYYTGMKIFDLIGDEAAVAQAHEGLCSLLPEYWNKPETEPGRIFQKNNPWANAECDSLASSP